MQKKKNCFIHNYNQSCNIKNSAMYVLKLKPHCGFLRLDIAFEYFDPYWALLNSYFLFGEIRQPPPKNGDSLRREYCAKIDENNDDRSRKLFG